MTLLVGLESPASPPVETAAAQVVNAIPAVLTAEPGLHTRLDLRGAVPWVVLARRRLWEE